MESWSLKTFSKNVATAPEMSCNLPFNWFNLSDAALERTGMAPCSMYLNNSEIACGSPLITASAAPSPIACNASTIMSDQCTDSHVLRIARNKSI